MKKNKKWIIFIICFVAVFLWMNRIEKVQYRSESGFVLYKEITTFSFPFNKKIESYIWIKDSNKFIISRKLIKKGNKTTIAEYKNGYLKKIQVFSNK